MGHINHFYKAHTKTRKILRISHQNGTDKIIQRIYCFCIVLTQGGPLQSPGIQFE